MSQNSYLYAFFVVFLAGIFWSFGALTVRYMVDGHQYVFQYLFYRGIAIAIILLIYLFLKEGISFYKNFKRYYDALNDNLYGTDSKDFPRRKGEK